MLILITFERGDWALTFSRHAITRAAGRRIYWDLIRSTVFEGEIERRGGEFLWFTKRFNKGKVVCKARITHENEARVVTIEWRR